MPITCAQCGKELPDNTQFCGECGTAVKTEKKPDYCSNCFAELPEDAKFCLHCGKPAAAAQPNTPHQEPDQAIRDELYETVALKTFGEINDFEENKARLVGRALKWAEYETSGWERIHWFEEAQIRLCLAHRSLCFMQESNLFSTNKPNKHRALFYKAFRDFNLFKLREQSALSYDNPPKPTPLFLTYLRNVHGYSDEDLDEFVQDYTYELLEDMNEIAVWETKDDELFLPPQPIRAEAAGAILNFTTDEAVLVVYADCSCTDKIVELSIELQSLNRGLQRAGINTATILERSSGDTKVCAAIFNPIPFVTNEVRNKEQVLQETDAKVSAHLPSRVEKKIKLFRGNVNELDWRGRK